MGFRWMHKLMIAATLVILAGPAAGQDGGALPKGNTKALDKGKASGPKEKKNRRRNCYLDLARPPGTNGWFTPDGKSLYLLANVGDDDDEKRQKAKKAKKGRRRRVKFTLYHLDLTTMKSEALVSLTHLRDASLQVHGQPPKGISAVAFVGRSASCYEGPAGVVSVSFAKKGSKAVRSRGRHLLVEGPAGLVLADQKKRKILEFDTGTFQVRSVLGFPAGERPLFFDPGSRDMVTWHEEKRGLVHYSGGKSKPDRRLQFKKGHKVLQQEGRFGVAEFSLKDNSIEIRELPNWTGDEKAKPASYKIKVPPAYTVTSAGITVNFATRQALVHGSNFLAKQRWQRVFVYDYGKSEEHLVGVPVTGNQYLNFAGIDPTGRLAIIEARDITTRKTIGLKIYDFAKKSFEDLLLGNPGTPD